MNKLVFLVSLFLVALAVLDNHHGVHSKSIRVSLRSTENPSEEKVVVDQAPAYNQFYLALQWAGTICKFQNCTTKPKTFTIHGLWPQNTTAWPQNNCCGGLVNSKCNYNDSAINASLRSQIAVSWPDLSGNNSEFWEQQWKDHGACSVDEIPLPSYFQKANALYKTPGRDFFTILKNKGFKADGSPYCVTDIKKAIKDSTGLDVILNCHLDTSDTTSYLKEIHVCVNQKATAFQSCGASSTADSSCKGLPFFPAPPL